MKKNIIYGLKDPRNDVFCYIGKTTVGVNRPLRHLIKSHSSLVNSWVIELSNLNLSPIVEIIEDNIELNDLSNREKYWIQEYYNLNDDLLNIKNKKSNKEIANYSIDLNLIKSLGIFLDGLPNFAKSIRYQNRLTQSQLSETLHISRSTLSLLERGKNIDLQTIKKLIRLFLSNELPKNSKHKIRLNQFN